MTALLIVGAAWTAVAVPVAVLIGRSVRVADEAAHALGVRVPDLVPADWIAETTEAR